MTSAEINRKLKELEVPYKCRFEPDKLGRALCVHLTSGVVGLAVVAKLLEGEHPEWSPEVVKRGKEK